MSIDSPGTYAYEFDLWTLPSSGKDSKQFNWMNFGGLKNQGDCKKTLADDGKQ